MSKAGWFLTSLVTLAMAWGLLDVGHVHLSAGPPVNARGPDFCHPDRTVGDGLYGTTSSHATQAQVLRLKGGGMQGFVRPPG